MGSKDPNDYRSGNGLYGYLPPLTNSQDNSIVFPPSQNPMHQYNLPPFPYSFSMGEPLGYQIQQENYSQLPINVENHHVMSTTLNNNPVAQHLENQDPWISSRSIDDYSLFYIYKCALNSNKRENEAAAARDAVEIGEGSSSTIQLLQPSFPQVVAHQNVSPILEPPKEYLPLAPQSLSTGYANGIGNNNIKLSDLASERLTGRVVIKPPLKRGRGRPPKDPKAPASSTAKRKKGNTSDRVLGSTSRLDISSSASTGNLNWSTNMITTAQQQPEPNDHTYFPPLDSINPIANNTPMAILDVDEEENQKKKKIHVDDSSTWVKRGNSSDSLHGSGLVISSSASSCYLNWSPNMIINSQDQPRADDTYLPPLDSVKPIANDNTPVVVILDDVDEEENQKKKKEVMNESSSSSSNKSEEKAAWKKIKIDYDRDGSDFSRWKHLELPKLDVQDHDPFAILKWVNPYMAAGDQTNQHGFWS